jgi:hypothetical protein
MFSFLPNHLRLWSAHQNISLTVSVQVILGEPAIPNDWTGQLAKLSLDAIDNAFALFLKSESLTPVKLCRFSFMSRLTAQSRAPALTVCQTRSRTSA